VKEVLEPKKTTSNEVKQRWNDLHYTQVKVSVSPGIAAGFKTACLERGVSMASVLAQYMVDYSTVPDKAPPGGEKPDKTKEAKPLSTRKQRRACIDDIIRQMNEVLTAEERFYDNVPDNFQGSRWHEASEASISAMGEIIELLAEVYE
jgi:hypothetical protein